MMNQKMEYYMVEERSNYIYFNINELQNTISERSQSLKTTWSNYIYMVFME